MTVMRIAIPDDLKQAFDKAFPGESPEAVVERLIRAEVERQQPKNANEMGSLVETFRRLAAKFPPLSSNEISRLREDGRP